MAVKNVGPEKGHLLLCDGEGEHLDAVSCSVTSYSTPIQFYGQLRCANDLHFGLRALTPRQVP